MPNGDGTYCIQDAATNDENDKLLVGKTAFEAFTKSIQHSASALPVSYHPMERMGWKTAYLILPPQW